MQSVKWTPKKLKVCNLRGVHQRGISSSTKEKEKVKITSDKELLRNSMLGMTFK
jgi:hypothetical protein